MSVLITPIDMTILPFKGSPIHTHSISEMAHFHIYGLCVVNFLRSVLNKVQFDNRVVNSRKGNKNEIRKAVT